MRQSASRPRSPRKSSAPSAVRERLRADGRFRGAPLLSRIAGTARRVLAGFPGKLTVLQRSGLWHGRARASACPGKSVLTLEHTKLCTMTADVHAGLIPGSLLRIMCLVIESKAFQYPRRMLRYAGCPRGRSLGSGKMQQVSLLPAWG